MRRASRCALQHEAAGRQQKTLEQQPLQEEALPLLCTGCVTAQPCQLPCPVIERVPIGMLMLSLLRACKRTASMLDEPSLTCWFSWRALSSPSLRRLCLLLCSRSWFWMSCLTPSMRAPFSSSRLLH